jgi:hypothetical protein
MKILNSPEIESRRLLDSNTTQTAFLQILEIELQTQPN